MAVTLNASTVSGFIQSADTSGVLQLQTANTTAISIDASQKVGIGTATPRQTLSVGATLDLYSGSSNSPTVPSIRGSGANNLVMNAYSTGIAYINFDSGSGGLIVADGSQNTLMRLDGSGNLGLGVTPSAWGGSGVKGFQIASAGALLGSGGGMEIRYNAYYNGTNDIYITSQTAFKYMQQFNLGHAWYTAASGTAGNAITFTQAMTLDASGNLLLNKTSQWSTEQFTISGSSSTQRFSYFRSTSAGHYISLGTNGTLPYVEFGNGAGLAFNDGTTERARIDSSGNLLVGTTSGTRKLCITYTAASGGIYLETSNADSTFLSCIRSATVHVQHKIIGSAYQIVNDSAGVSLAAGGTSWGSLSDERKKDIIESITDATNKVSTLRAVIGKYKTDEEGTRRAFLIAQDVQAALPEAVVEDSSGDLILQYTDTIPLLVAAIQELNAKVEALEAQIKG